MSTGPGAVRDEFRQRSFAPLLILLGTAIVINYVDRGNLSIAAPVIKNELQLSATELGILFSAFFYTYTALQFVIGGIVDRFGANRVLSAGLLVWSVATVAMGFASGFLPCWRCACSWASGSRWHSRARQK
jgi:sugar phosphate permease